MASTSDILIAKGAAQANAISQRGNIYADLIKNLGGVPGQLIQDQRRQQMQDLQQREQMVRLGLLQQQSANEQQLQPGRVEAQQNENALSGQRAKAGQQDADIQHIIGSTPRKPDGSLDVDGIAQLAGAHDPGMVPHATELAQKLNLESSDYQERVDSLRNDKLGEIGMQLSRRPNDLGGFQLAVSTLSDKGVLEKDQAQRLLDGAVADPGTIKQTADQWIRGSAKASAALKGENVKLGSGESLVRVSPEGTTQTLASAPNTRKTEAELAADAADPNSPTQKQSQVALTLTPQALAQAETARHNSELERINKLNSGREAAAAAETARHNKATEAAAATHPKLTRVEHKDPTTGRTIIEYLTPEQIQANGPFEKGVGAATEARLASAQTVNQIGNSIVEKLKDPAFAKNVGPAMGRYSSLREFIGNPPPEYAELAGQIESYSLGSMGVHGMRSAVGAEKIKTLLDQKHTPEALAATIKGLNDFSEKFMANEGRVATPSAPAASSRIRVTGPNGESGTVPAGTALPDGWKAAQ